MSLHSTTIDINVPLIVQKYLQFVVSFNWILDHSKHLLWIIAYCLLTGHWPFFSSLAKEVLDSTMKNWLNFGGDLGILRWLNEQQNTIIVVAYPDRGAGNDPKRFFFFFFLVGGGGGGGSPSLPRLNIFTVGSMGVMICLGQGGLRALSASSLCMHYFCHKSVTDSHRKWNHITKLHCTKSTHYWSWHIPWILDKILLHTVHQTVKIMFQLCKCPWGHFKFSFISKTLFILGFVLLLKPWKGWP